MQWNTTKQWKGAYNMAESNGYYVEYNKPGTKVYILNNFLYEISESAE